MRLVLDTNCVISAFLWGGTPYKIIEQAVEGKCELFTSGTLLVEIEDVLLRAKFAVRLIAAHTTVAQLLAEYTAQATVVHAPSIAPTITADPDDDAVLACALAAKADLIVSGDIHLLDLKSYQQIPIVSPSVALARLAEP